MKVDPNKYIVAQTSHDYKQCHALRRKTGDNQVWEFTFPTVLALDDDGNCIGYLSRHPTDKMVLVNNLTLDPELPRTKAAIVSMRLMEAFEIQLESAGVQWYWFGIGNGNTRLIDTMEQLGLTLQYEQDNHRFYKRELNGQSIS